MSSINIRKELDILSKEIRETQKDFQKKKRKKASLQNDNFQKEIFKKLNEGTVLNFIRSSNKKVSSKTNFSDISKEIQYDLCMVNKFDENLNSSLSFISEFDLEAEENKYNNNSFDSSDNEENIEEIDIISKNNKKKSDAKEDEEFNSKIEKDWMDIKELLLNKKSS